MIGIDAGLIIEQRVLARETEDGKVARKFQEATLADDDVGVRVGAAYAGNRALLQKLVPLGKVLLWSAREAKQREALIHGIDKRGDEKIDDRVFSPDRIVVEDLDAIVVGDTPIAPAVAKSEGMRNEVDGVRAAGGGHEGAGVAAGAAGPGVVDAEREEMSARGGDFFAIDDRKVRGVGGSDFGLRHRLVVVGDGQER